MSGMASSGPFEQILIPIPKGVSIEMSSFAPVVSEKMLLEVRRQAYAKVIGILLVHTRLWAITWANLPALLYVMFSCVFVTFQ